MQHISPPSTCNKIEMYYIAGNFERKGFWWISKFTNLNLAHIHVIKHVHSELFYLANDVEFTKFSFPTLCILPWYIKHTHSVHVRVFWTGLNSFLIIFFFLAKYCSSGAKKHAFAPPTSGHGSAAVLSTRCSQLDERSEAIKAIKEFTSHLTTPSHATPIHTSARKNRLTEYVVDRNTTAIINELSQNNDYKVR